MCTRTRAYLTLLREYKAEIVMIVGFAAAAIMYADMRTFINEQTRTLTEINLRLSNLEHQTQNKYRTRPRPECIRLVNHL